MQVLSLPPPLFFSAGSIMSDQYHHSDEKWDTQGLRRLVDGFCVTYTALFFKKLVEFQYGS